jgi:hypothetical protein
MEEPAVAVSGRIGWPFRTWRAAGFAVSDGGAAATALAGFLVRGGIVLLILPIVVLPSVIDLAGMTGVHAISIGGQPTPWLVAVIAVGIAVAVAWLAVVVLVGSVLDFWLVQMRVEFGRNPSGAAGQAEGSSRDDSADGQEPAGSTASARRRELPDLGLLLTVALIRILSLAPLGIALIWATARIYDTTYDQLLTPTNLATPLPVRVVLAATDVVAVVAAVWLAGETFGAIAVRRAILDRRGFRRALGSACSQIVRRPLSTLTTTLLSYGVSAVAIILSLALCATAFDSCRAIARTHYPFPFLGSTVDLRPVAFAMVAMVLVVAWAIALLISAVTSAWRSGMFTAEAVAAGAGSRSVAAT